MAVIVPSVINWSVTPQNGVDEYFNVMNTWLTESTSVINSFNTSIQKVNENNTEINELTIQSGQSAASASASAAQSAQSALIAQSSANFQGNWSSKGYTVGQSVVLNGVIYLCTTTHTTAQNPSTTTGFWIINVAIGAVGNITSPLLDLPLKNSLTMKAGVGSITFTRASTATYIDRYGVLKTAAVDEPRFEKEGYLNEGASTNLLLNSATLTTQNITLIIGTTYTLSFYGTGSISLTNAFVGTLVGVGLFPSRATLTFVATTTTLTLTPSGTCSNCQLESLPFATSYIPTTGATVTRSADILEVTRANNFPNAESNAEGYSVTFTYDSLGIGSANQFLWSIFVSSANYVEGFLSTTYNSLRNIVANNGAVMSNTILPVKPLGSNKVVQTQSNTFLKQYVNGLLAGTTANNLGTLGGGVNSLIKITIGGLSGTSTSKLFGHISSFKVYDRELTPTEIALL